MYAVLILPIESVCSVSSILLAKCSASCQLNFEFNVNKVLSSPVDVLLAPTLTSVLGELKSDRVGCSTARCACK